jgi:hypothetical protein
MIFATFTIVGRERPRWRFRRHSSPAQQHLTRKQARALEHGTADRDVFSLYLRQIQTADERNFVFSVEGFPASAHGNCVCR